MSGVIQQLVDCIHEDDALRDVDFCVGRLAQKEFHSPPFVAWVPTTHTYEAPEYVGLRISALKGRKQVLTRLQNLEVSIRGADIEHTECMVDAVAASIIRQARGSAILGAAVWTTQAEGTAEYSQDGERVMLEVTFRVPVFESEHDLTQLTGEGTTAKFVSDLDGSEETIISP